MIGVGIGICGDGWDSMEWNAEKTNRTCLRRSSSRYVSYVDVGKNYDDVNYGGKECSTKKDLYSEK